MTRTCNKMRLVSHPRDKLQLKCAIVGLWQQILASWSEQNVGQSISILGCQACMARMIRIVGLRWSFVLYLNHVTWSWCWCWQAKAFVGQACWPRMIRVHSRLAMIFCPVPWSCSLILIFLFWSLMLEGRALVFWEESHAIAGRSRHCPVPWSCRAEGRYSHINEACRWEDGE